ncbi:phage portal protein [Sphingobacterium faecium]|uniref:phage portal protein n=1 Tax=Sphingobacterium faecium TaxID=34087 RepID=UPI00247ADF9A|nr:phage portal protein [Sphingobacterium faecium]WGQ15591.1 phage portal protein [Sphingobacterium faecium]
MKIEELNNKSNFKESKSYFEKNKRVIEYNKKKYTIKEILKEYDPLQHKVTDPKFRPDKMLSEEGESIIDATDNNTIRNTVDYSVATVNRLPLPIQKRIVLIAATFLVGERINIESNAEGKGKDLERLVRKLWDDNKLDYESKNIAKLMMSETHCAELWYDYSDTDYWKDTILKESTKKVGVMILAESKGDQLYPIFDEYQDLVAFGRGYKVKVESKEVEHFDYYTKDLIIKGVLNGKEWEVDSQNNPYKAIPVIYYSQDRPEWSDVQPLIERKETRVSDFADTNDYFADPALVANGEVENLPSKGEVGKQFQVKNGGTVDYLTWDNAPESTKMEFDILDQEIFANTHTPDISFGTMKALIGNISGIALKLLFMDAQIKASDKQEYFGKCIQRRLNLLKKIIMSLSPMEFVNVIVVLKPIFKSFMPVNEVEYNTMLIEAFNAGMISRKTMIAKSTLVSNPDEEITEVLKDLEEKAKIIGKNNVI